VYCLHDVQTEYTGSELFTRGVVATGAGVEENVTVPLSVTDIESLRPQLNLFVHLYNLNFVSDRRILALDSSLP